MWKFLAELFGIEQPPPVQQQRPPQQQQRRPQQIYQTSTPPDASRRRRYITAQAQDLNQRFSQDGGDGIRLDENCNWIVIPKYPMPERWRQRWTSLMLLFPAAYPDVPPTGFYLTIRARLKSGGHEAHLFKGGGYYADAPDLSSQGWFWYCVHAQVGGAGGWQPSSDPLKPDNLFTFLNMAREALSTEV